MKFVLLFLLLGGVFSAPDRRPMNKRGKSKIVGGTDVELRELTYQLSLQDTSFGENYHICGATMVTIEVFVTAAQCVYGQDSENPQNLVVVGGIVSLANSSEYRQEVELREIHVYDGFNNESLFSDIAVLIGATRFNASWYADTIRLPNAYEVFYADCTVSGWGTISEGGPSSDTLQKVTVSTIADSECRKVYGDLAIRDSMICAGGEAGKDACLGDTGGPMQYDGELIGVVSWGHGCGEEDYPGVYTEVSYFVNWIRAFIV